MHSHFYKLSKEDFDEVLEGYPELKDRMVGEALGRLRKMTRVRSHLGEDMPAEDLRDSAASCGEEETMNTKQSAICSTKSVPRRASPHRAAARDRRLSFESQPPA